MAIRQATVADAGLLLRLNREVQALRGAGAAERLARALPVATVDRGT